MMNYDVLIPAHGESVQQIETLLYSIFLQKSGDWKLGNVFLCSDNPKHEYSFGNRSCITFLHQEPLRGKPNALNMMLKKGTAPYCVQNSADCIPASEHTYNFLLRHFSSSVVGAVTSNPMPFNDGVMWLPNIVWRCHDFVQPKLNAELFAFRRDLIEVLPETVIHDDSYIHNIVEKEFQIVYEPKAIVFNSAPKRLSEFYLQRKKNVVGNIQLAKDFRMNPPKFIRLRTLILMSLELLANVHGRLDYVRGKIPKGLVGYNLETTKEVIL